MPPKKTKTVKKVLKKEIDETSTDEEIAFALGQARATLVQARRNMTRILNQCHDTLKQDGKLVDNQNKAKTMLQKAAERYEELEMAYNALVMLKQEPDEDEWAMAEGAWMEIQAAFIGWFPKKPDPIPAAPEGAKGDAKVPIYMGLNFDATKHIKDKFSGTDPRVYQSWRLNWNLVQKKMEDLGYTPAQQLMELKKVTKEQAHDLIRSIPEEDANLVIALATLDKVYKNNIKVAELAITDLLAAGKVQGTSKSVMEAFIAISTAENTLNGMAITPEQRGQLLFQVIAESKLNNSLIKNWEDVKQTKADPAHPLGHTATQKDFEDMMLAQYHLYLTYENNKKVDASRSGDSTSDKDKKKKEEEKKKEEKKKNPTVPGGYGAQSGKKEDSRSSASASARQEKNCFACKNKGHWITECRSFLDKKSGEERMKLLKDHQINVCRNCLRGAHPTKACKKGPQCNKCSTPKFHHPLLHNEEKKSSSAAQKKQDENEDESKKKKETPQESPQETKTAGAVRSAKEDAKPILQSCRAWLVTAGGEKHIATVFLDGGSELTLIRRGFANETGLNGKPIPFSMTVAGGGETEETLEREVKFQLMSIDRSYMTPMMVGVTQKKITRDLRPVDVDLKKFQHLKDIQFTDDYPRGERQVDILIGVQYYTTLLRGEVIRGRPDEPQAVNTKLGYVLSGST